MFSQISSGNKSVAVKVAAARDVIVVYSGVTTTITLTIVSPLSAPFNRSPNVLLVLSITLLELKTIRVRATLCFYSLLAIAQDFTLVFYFSQSKFKVIETTEINVLNGI
jgi:hypothetical protein